MSTPGFGDSGALAFDAALTTEQLRAQARSATPSSGAPKVLTGVPYIVPLKEQCVQVIADNFEANPTFGALPPLYVKKIIDLLPLDLPLELVGTLIEDESYWERRSNARWRNCDCTPHGCSWKQLYFERNLEHALERFDPATSDAEGLQRMLVFSKRFVSSIRLQQLPSHLDLHVIFDVMATSLTCLGLTYGMRNVGMDYDRSLFGMKLSDCRSLAKCLERTETLTYLDLRSNMLDDDRVRMVASGLVDNLSVTHLDLSHNRIADRGVRAIAKLLDSRSVLTSLNLSDNAIHTEGGRALARALRSNVALLDLRLRLNRLGDEGGRAILDVLKVNQNLVRLNLAANSMGAVSASSLAAMLRENGSLREIVLTSNDLGVAGEEVCRDIRDAVEESKSLEVLDVRSCNLGLEVEAAITETLHARVDSQEMANIVKDARGRATASGA